MTTQEEKQAQEEALGFEVFWKIHEGLPKQGPGSDASTRRALEAAGPLPSEPKVLDLGCGPGRQSVVLAEETGGTVEAVDLIPAFLAQADALAEARGVSDRFTTRQASMAELADPDGAYDLIWSEGAIYNIGFSNGLGIWRRLLGARGMMAVTEVSWLIESPPEETQRFWTRHYPGIRSDSENQQLVEQAGYHLRERFVLPESEWWDDYYTLIEARVVRMKQERPDPIWLNILSAFDEEIRIVREGLGSFGYVFYIMEKTERP